MATTEFISSISLISECDTKELSLVLSTGLDTISKYQEGSPELQMKQRLADYFSIRAKTNLAENFIENLRTLGMTPEELGIEIIKRIGVNDGFWYKGWYGNHRKGCVSQKNAKKILHIVTQEIEDLKTQYNIEIENNKVITLIPADYRYPLALETMLGFVKNLRASTWKECVDLYEEQLYRWKMLENSAENLRLQHEIRNLTGTAANSAKAAAIFSGLNFLLK